MKRKILSIIAFVLVVLVGIGLFTKYIDSARVRNGVEPKFTVKIVSDDGSKVTYWGLGYKVIRYVGVSPKEPYQSNIGVKMGNWFMKYELPKNENGMTTEPYIPEGMDRPNQDNTGMPVKEKEYNRSPENVRIEVIEDTITNTGLTIIITDNNEDYYGWGVDFKVEEKVDDGWKCLEPVSGDLSWIEIAYVPNENNQITQKLDIEKYYGKLTNGTYRIVKPVYDNGYINIYSNEFEIK